MTLNDPALIQLSADSRALVRNAIRSNPGWKAYAAANDCDLASMTTKEAILACCDALSIDVVKVVAGEIAVEPPKTIGPRIGATLLDAAERPVKVERAPRAAPTTDKTPGEAAQALVDLFASMNKAAPLDIEAVHAAIDARLEPVRADIAKDVKTLIGIMQEQQGAVRLELKRGGEITPVAGSHHPQFATLLQVLASRQADGHAPNIWIAGPAGSGKTFAAKTAAAALKVAFHYNGALSMPHELLGFIDAAGTYHRTPFREAFEHGGVFLFDEVDGSDNSALLALNAALANGTATFPDAQISRHADCYVIATANTWGLGATADYVGRAKIDAAFLSRFPVRLEWDYDAKLEQAICGNADFAKRVQAARAKARSAGIKILIDPRASIAGSALIANGMTPDRAAALTYLANLSAEQRKTVEG